MVIACRSSRTILVEGGKIPSAVLACMFEEAGEARVILTRRSKTLRFHQGEVSFPGGRCDVGETAAACALREADEETGLDPGLGEVAGYLSPISTFSSQSFITPVVGFLDGRPRPRRPTRRRLTAYSTSSSLLSLRTASSARNGGRFRSGSSSFPATPCGVRRRGC